MKVSANGGEVKPATHFCVKPRSKRLRSCPTKGAITYSASFFRYRFHFIFAFPQFVRLNGDHLKRNEAYPFPVSTRLGPRQSPILGGCMRKVLLALLLLPTAS